MNEALRSIKKYVLEVFRLSEFENIISYGDESKNTVVAIEPSGFFDHPREPATPLERFRVPSSEALPILFGKNFIREQGSRIYLELDLIASSFYLLTRYEEILRPKVRDQHGRFPGRESIQYRSNFLNRPIVDEYGEYLAELLRGKGVAIPKTPRVFNKVELTHDIDTPFRWNRLRTTFRDTLKRISNRQPGNPIQPIRSYLNLDNQDPYNTFDWILNQNQMACSRLKNAEFETIFFAMTGGKSRFDGLYSINEPKIRTLLKKLQSSRSIIGLHPSYEAGARPALIAKEAQKLERATGRPVTHSRHHYLRQRDPSDCRSLISSGIKHDYTMAYADVIGFRNGTCRPFKWYDIINQSQTELTIHPTVIMDCTLEDEKYMHLALEQAKEACSRILEEIVRFNGDVVLLWHNSQFTTIDKNNDDYHKSLYTFLLRKVSELDDT